MLRIDFISDINCPWCALGLANLEAALAQLDDSLKVELHFQPFELNPQLPSEGMSLVQYLRDKYGMEQAQIDATHQRLESMGAEAGFRFGQREMIWNSFDAHRLLYWAEAEGSLELQRQLKLALMHAYQGEGRDISDTAVLVEVAASAGLDPEHARDLLTKGTYTEEVRAAEAQWQQAGIQAVPSMVINQRQLLQGAQPVEAIMQALQTLKNG